jgi:Ulp1 family protease
MAGTEQVDSRNIGRFKSGQWLADDNISYYLALITARNASDPKYPKIHAFNTFFYAKIDVGGQKAVKRWTKKVCLALHYGMYERTNARLISLLKI